MAWLPISGTDPTSQKVLHLKLNDSDKWMPYNAPQFNRLRQPDTAIPTSHGTPSKGYRTAQILLQNGWKYVQSLEAESQNN